MPSFWKNLGNSAAHAGKTTLNGAIQATRGALVETGRAAIHAIAPDEYEYYLCSLELLDGSGERQGFISFVVMPDQIVESHTPIQTMTKTHSGIVTTFNPSFSPIDITISGTFGKKFRLVTGLADPMKRKGGGLNLSFGKLATTTVGAKSGYGLMKILEHILIKSEKIDESTGKPYFVIFNNYAFNTHYVVNIVNYNFQQSYDQNMIWHYNVVMKAVAEKPKGLGMSMSHFLGSVAANSMANGMTKLIAGMAGNAMSSISNGLDKIGLNKLGI